ncbi:MAG: NAD-dependent epimerase/dehydratase family protein [Planctomycetota bacterium]
MRILLTGGAGFIGSHLADRLVELGGSVTVLDDLSTGSLSHLSGCAKQIRFVRGSVLEPDRIEKLVAGTDRVVHLAAAVGVDRVARDPAGARRVIAEGSSSVLEHARKRQVPLLMVSSSEVYGFSPPCPIREEDVLSRIAGVAPRLAYAQAKLEADRMAREAAREGARVLTLRPFNVVGPRQGDEGGAVLPGFCKSALLGRPLEVHGSGQQRRTFLDVRDLARLLAGLVRMESFPVDALNVGGTEEWSMRELAERVVELVGSRSEIAHVRHPSSRGGVEVQRRVPDLSRLGSLVELGPRRGIDSSIRALAAELRDSLTLAGTV